MTKKKTYTREEILRSIAKSMKFGDEQIDSLSLLRFLPEILIYLDDLNPYSKKLLTQASYGVKSGKNKNGYFFQFKQLKPNPREKEFKKFNAELAKKYNNQMFYNPQAQEYVLEVSFGLSDRVINFTGFKTEEEAAARLKDFK